MKCAVVGGGLSGLSAAAYLSSNNIDITLFESSPKLGGRVYSFSSSLFPKPVDNGQHLLMGCYSETLAFMRLIGASSNLSVQNNFIMHFVDENGNHSVLRAGNLFYPFNILAAILRFKGLDFLSKRKIISLMIRLRVSSKPTAFSNESVHDWLNRFSQTENAVKYLWEVLAIGTMNADTKESSATMFEYILKEIFFRGSFNSKFIIPGSDLSAVFCAPASKYILSNKCNINLSQSIVEISKTSDNRFQLTTKEGLTELFDKVIFALPLFALKRIKGIHNFITLADDTLVKYAPIITFHIKLKKNNLAERYYCVLDSPIQWLFNSGGHITTVTSAAEKFADVPENILWETFKKELESKFEISEEDIESHLLIKEKRATFVSSNEFNKFRTSIFSKEKGIALAGDWTDTGLPATIEGAVLSGSKSAKEIMKTLI